MHKVGSKDSVSGLQKFVLFHLMNEISSNLPHIVYLNIPKNMKTLGGVMTYTMPPSCVVNLKVMKVDIRRNKPIPLVDQDDIQQRRPKKLAKIVADEDKALETFGLSKKVQRILRE